MKNIIGKLFIIFLTFNVCVAFDASSRTKRAKRGGKSRTVKVEQQAAVVERPAREPFVRSIDAPTADSGLAGRNIALWQSHGRYFDLKEGRWMWQRARLLGTVEDLFSPSFVVPYLIPMLENAGAYVMTPRERDVSEVEIIVDRDGGFAHDGYSESHHGAHHWRTLDDVAGFGYKKKVLTGFDNPFVMGHVREIQTVADDRKASTAAWHAEFPRRGTYAVYVSYASLPNSSRNARYVVNSLAGSREFEVNQRIGGGTWVYLGTFPFAAGKSDEPVVVLSNATGSDDEVVTADAVKIGGGMGNVGRSASVDDDESPICSGCSRFAEGARYWLQWAGIPSEVYSVTEGVNDYEDDYKSRGLWVNHLAGGSSELPGRPGLGIPVDLSFAFHTDAGTTPDSASTVGTMPIVYTKGERLGNGERRTTSLRYAELVAGQIVADLQALYEPTWNRRKLRDRQYHEVMTPQVPSLLVELLSHQNFADMRLGLDPTFRFAVGRAIYKGILKYIHEKDSTPFIVSPLPVSRFAIKGRDGEYKLTWTAVNDSLEPTAVPTYYIVYERVDDGEFTELAVVESPSLDVKVSDNRIYSYKVVAANDGGVSFPSEVLSLCDMHGSGKEQVLIVNGFTRVSGPAEFYGSGRSGFDFADDYGVADGYDFHFTGAQTEFRSDVKWVANDAPGYGASRATHELSLIAGNTFDFVSVHGRSIRKAGHPFVSCSVEAYAAGSVADSTIRIVDLILGKQKEIAVGAKQIRKFKPFSSALKSRLVDFCNSGGALIVSGSNVGGDLFDNPFSNSDEQAFDKMFGSTILGIRHSHAKATAVGAVREVRSPFREFHGGLSLTFNQQLNSDCYAVESPESYLTVDGGVASAICRYAENDYIAGVAFDSETHRAVTLGFPFETVTETAKRDALMSKILRFVSSSKK